MVLVLLITLVVLHILDIIFRQRFNAIVEKTFKQEDTYSVNLRLKTIMFEMTPYSQIACDENGKILMWNGRAEDTFGYIQEEVLGKNIDIIIPDKYREMHRIGMKRWKSTGHSKLIDNELGVYLEGLHKDGSTFPMHLKLVSINDKGFKTIGGYARNVQVEAKEKKLLIDNDIFYKETLRTGKIGGWQWDLDTGKMIMDENASKIFNVDHKKDITASILVDLIYPKDQLNSVLITNRAVANKDDHYETYFRRMKLDGSLLWIYFKGCMILDKDGNIAKIHGILKELGPANTTDEKYNSEYGTN